MWILWAPPAVVAQSTTSGTVTGSVRTVSFQPVGQALVSLTPIGSGNAYTVTTTTTGSFTINLVQPGSYVVRVEALGYRPLVARVLTVSGGERQTLSLTLTQAQPPVVQVDTVMLGPSASTRWRAGAVQLGGMETEGLPYRFDDLGSITALSTSFDESLGVQGLPGDLTLIIADGVPFYRAPHPTSRHELLPDALFPRSALSGLSAVHSATDAEWSGSAGGYVGLSTRTTTAPGGVEADVAYSGNPLWSSGELDIDKPSLLSLQGGLRGTVPIDAASRLILSGEALSHETPLAPRASESLGSQLTSLDPGLVATLTDPGVERYERYSGLARYDLQQGTSNQFFLRGASSFSRRRFDGAGALSMSGPSALAEESIEFSTAMGLVSRYSRTTTLEFRAGFSGSYRDFGSSFPNVLPAYLVGNAASLGDVPSSIGSADRTDFVAIPVARWSPGDGNATLKFGARIRASSHAMSRARPMPSDFFFSDADALQAGSGFASTTSAPEASFGTQEYGLFAQYEGLVRPGIRLRIGGRYDYEAIGGDGVLTNADWRATTGLDNAIFDDSHHQLGFRASVTWDPDLAGRTRVFLTASRDEGDVDIRAISDLYAQATSATSTRYAGSDIGWPTGGIPPLAAPAAPSLTLVGPDMRAPRSTNFSIGLLHRFGSALTTFVQGTSRRTDFLTRRRNLNLPLVPQALDPNGRRIYGSLTQDGSVLTTTADDARRFPAFGEVWALDPDGWSKYFGVTAGVERRSERLDVYGSYSYSETTDNWMGARGANVGGELTPGLPTPEGAEDWSEGTSDFDVPHRAVVAVTGKVGDLLVSALYRFRSGAPFTPRYRMGVDANGDGSNRNDVAFVPADLSALTESWSCLTEQAGTFATRNSCRGPASHTINLRMRYIFAQLVGRPASITVDGLNLIETSDAVIDEALLLVDPTGTITTSPDGSTITIPTTVNPGFGDVLYPTSRGRMLRVGVRIGG
jgi:hypothetical protein